MRWTVDRLEAGRLLFCRLSRCCLFRFLPFVALLAGCSAAIVPGAPLATLDGTVLADSAVKLDETEGARFAIPVPAGVDQLTVFLDDGAADTFFTVSSDGVERCSSASRCVMADLPPTLTVDVHGTLQGTLSWTTAVRLGDGPSPSDAPAPPAPDDVPADDLVCDLTAADMPSVTDVCVTSYVSCGDTIEATVDGGSQHFDHTYWADHQTLGGLTNDSAAVDGAERVFVVADVPAGQWVHAEVESCEPVWASYLMTGEVSGVCSLTSFGAKGHFEANQDRTVQDVTVVNSMSSVRDVHLIVDSHPGADTSFKLNIRCGF
jgi:hypothetical protein